MMALKIVIAVFMLASAEEPNILDTAYIRQNAINIYNRLYSEQQRINSLECVVDITISHKLSALDDERSDLKSGVNKFRINGKKDGVLFQIDGYSREKRIFRIVLAHDDFTHFYINDEQWDIRWYFFNRARDRYSEFVLFSESLFSNFFFPLTCPDGYVSMHRISVCEERPNILRASIKDQFNIRSVPPMLLYYNRHDRVEKISYEEPKEIICNTNKGSALVLEDILVSSNAVWDKFVKKGNIYIPTEYKLYCATTDELLITACIMDVESTRINQDLTSAIEPPSTVTKVVEYECEYNKSEYTFFEKASIVVNDIFMYIFE